MNTKIGIAVVTLVIVGAGMLLVSNQGKQSQRPTNPSKEVNPSPSPEVMEKNTVTLTSSGFSPATITIKKGEKVVWVNKSEEVATVHSDLHPTHLLYPKLNLGQFDNGQSLSLVFDTPGTYSYHDHLHPSRVGKVVVE